MAFTFRILFSGLCAFAPDRPIGRDPQSVLVVLPNILKPRLVKAAAAPAAAAVPWASAASYESAAPRAAAAPDKGGAPDQDFILPPHYPLLLFNMKNLQPAVNSRPLVYVKQDLSAKVDLGISPLLQTDVEIWVDGRKPEPGGLRVTNGEVQNQRMPTAAERNSLVWLTAIDGEEFGALRPELAAPLASDEQEVVARIELTSGRLRTNRLSAFEWESAVPGIMLDDPSRARFVATEIALEVEADQLVKLVFRPFGAESTKKLVLGPDPDAPNEDVEIRVENLEPERIMEMPREVYAPSTDPDLSVYYRLLAGFDEAAAHPVLRRIVHVVERSSGDGKPCAPVTVAKTG